MPQKCCCGCCTLATGTAVALLISVIQAVIGITWNTELLMLLNESENYNPLKYLIDERTLEDFDVIHGLTLAAIGLNGFWMFFAVIAARGNVTLNQGHLALWDVLTYLLTLFDLGATIYLAVKVQCSAFESTDLFVQSKPTKTMTYIVLLAGFSKGGVLMFLNVYLAHVVQLRGKEINHDQSVLALYVITHLAKCNRSSNDSMPLIPPPAYASSCQLFSPPAQPTNGRSDSSGSSWSLSYDAIQGMSHEPLSYGNIHPSLEYARNLTRNIAKSCQDESRLNDDAGSASIPH